MDLIIELLSDDVKKSVEFYATVLGAKTNQEFKEKGRLVWAEMTTPGGGRLQFYDRQWFGKEVAQFKKAGAGGTFILIFEVVDINSIWEKYKNRLEIADTLQKKEYGTIEFKFRDPSGYVVQLTRRN